MKKKSFLFVSCDEAKHICDKSQYNEATLWEKIKLSIRLIWCKFTRSYSKKNHKLTEAIQESNVDCLNQSERASINKEFKKELSKQEY